MKEYNVKTKQVFVELSKLPQQFIKRMPEENVLNFYKTMLECRKKTDALNPEGIRLSKMWLQHLANEGIIDNNTFLYHLERVKSIEL